MLLQHIRCFVFLASIIVGIDAHGYLSSPRSRNFVAYKDGAYSGGDASTPAKEYCPHCLNKGGTLGQCGVVENRNYDTPRNALGGQLIPDIQATYARGSQIDVEIVLTAMHKGHFEFNACPITAGGIATGDCFQNNPLEFVQDLLYGAPKDTNYPYRAYVPPSGYNKLITSNSGVSGTLYRYRFQLPNNLVGDHVLLQWHYLTGNTCVYPGYAQYRWPSDWPSPNSGAAICASIPKDGSGTPEQFWNCADVRIIDGAVPKPVPQSSIIQPVASPTRSTTGTCGNGKTGNGICPNRNKCCSKWGWCGTGSAYCSNRAGRTLATPSTVPCGNGTVGNGVCTNSKYCCSKFGFCGSGTAFCGVSGTGGTCGNGNRGNGICPNTKQCCSRFGYCGSDSSYCANSTSTVGTCGGGSVGNGVCQNTNYCCSKAGYCGTGSAYCGSSGTCGGGKVGNGICFDTKLCCSKAGYCGNTTAYCGNKAPVPTKKPSPRPVARPSKRPTKRPTVTTKRPTKRPTQKPTLRPNRRQLGGTCGNGDVGNGVCANPNLCCSRFGYCGSTSQYCNGAGTCGNGVVGNGVCRNPTFCCSKFGYCGFGSDYCSANKTSAVGTCGGGNRGNGICSNPNLCCSKAGYCGTGSAYCTANATSTSGTCGGGNRGNGVCPNANLCCSKAGYCGSTPAYCSNLPSGGTCGGGFVGNGRCQDPSLCCSKAGYCGTTPAYCGNKAPVAPPPTQRATPRPTQKPKVRRTPRPTNRPPVPRPTPRPVVPRPVARPTVRPAVPRPVAPPPTRRPTVRPSRVSRTNGRGGKVSSRTVGTCGGGTTGNGICTDASLCCSKWGWCGSTSEYCSNKSPQLASVTAVQTTPYPTPPPVSPGVVNCGSKSNVMNVNFGYYQSWAIWRQQGCNRVYPKDIDVAGNGYTHLAYSFASINANDQIYPWGGDYVGEEPQYANFNSLKTTNPGLKTSIAVGGWTFNDPGATQTRFSDVAASASRRATFAASVISFLSKYNFDGIDFDWEYPGDTERGGDAADIQNFPLLLKAVRDASNAAGKQIVISLAISVSPSRLNTGYNLAALAQHVDFFNLMAYDIHGVWDSPKVIGSHTDLSYINQSVQYFLQHGVPSNKMVLGLAAYGHTYNLANPNCNHLGCGFTSGGPGGCAGATGNMAYFTINQYVTSKNYNSLKFNPSTSSMEMVISGNVWISFDNPYTLGIKASYAASSCMRGTMWWAVDLLDSPIVL